MRHGECKETEQALAWEVSMNIGQLLAIVALVCGILMLIPTGLSGLPLAAIAIICLALNQSGLLGRLR